MNISEIVAWTSFVGGGLSDASPRHVIAVFNDVETYPTYSREKVQLFTHTLTARSRTLSQSSRHYCYQLSLTKKHYLFIVLTNKTTDLHTNSLWLISLVLSRITVILLCLLQRRMRPPEQMMMIRRLAAPTGSHRRG